VAVLWGGVGDDGKEASNAVPCREREGSARGLDGADAETGAVDFFSRDGDFRG